MALELDLLLFITLTRQFMSLIILFPPYTHNAVSAEISNYLTFAMTVSNETPLKSVTIVTKV